MEESSLKPEDVQPIIERFIGNLTEMQKEIVELRQRLRDTPDTMLRLDRPYDLEAELLAALEVVVHDDLNNAIRRLEAVAAATPESLRLDWERARQPLAELRPKIDSHRFSEEDRRAIYEDFLANRFAQLPAHLSPDDFELQVLHLFGRWMVTYRKLWEPHESAAGPSPRELLIVGSNEGLEPVYTPV
ncbi:MAG TPA: hypothetical protein VGS07_18395 [Thermoanaerobaculia bacterium]|jgi:hypothetical protein|nr:hypothetical protein [Thermoanaerobaculia bacterium]